MKRKVPWGQYRRKARQDNRSTVKRFISSSGLEYFQITTSKNEIKRRMRVAGMR